MWKGNYTHSFFFSKNANAILKETLKVCGLSETMCAFDYIIIYIP